MYRKIIVGYDGSAQSQDALALGKLIADASGASLIVAEVFYYSPRFGGRDPVLQDVEAEQSRQLEEAAASMGAEARAGASTSPARGLHDLAEETAADLIVVGSAHHGRAGQILAGSVGMSLLHGSPSSVAVAPHGYAGQVPAGIAELTVGFDGSAEADMALAEAIELARTSGATLKLVAVAEPPPIIYGKSGGANEGWQALMEEIEKVARGRLDEGVRSIPDDVRVEATLAKGEPVTSLAEIAVEGGGLLVLGSRAYGPLRRVLLGSVSAALVRSAPCPIIVHPRPAETPQPTAEPAKATTAE
jgi:nucleotide-binding universal stress UspA family protein